MELKPEIGISVPSMWDFGNYFLDLHDNGPTSPRGVLSQGAILHGKSLLVMSRHAGVQARTKRSFPPARPLAKNPARDSAGWKARFSGIFARLLPPAESISFWPERIILR